MSQWIALIVTLPLLFIAQLFCIFLHELGHATAAWLCGWTPILVKTGGGTAGRSFMLRGIEFRFAPSPFTGLTQMYAIKARLFRTIAIAGPLVTAVLIVAIWWALSADRMLIPSWISNTLLWLLFLQLSVFAGSLLPHMARVDGLMYPSDSLLAWQSLTMKRKDVPSHLLGHAYWAAETYLKRGQMKQAESLLASAVTGNAGMNAMNASVLWLHLLL
jgi:hypothetical protein